MKEPHHASLPLVCGTFVSVPLDRLTTIPKGLDRDSRRGELDIGAAGRCFLLRASYLVESGTHVGTGWGGPRLLGFSCISSVSSKMRGAAEHCRMRPAASLASLAAPAGPRPPTKAPANRLKQGEPLTKGGHRSSHSIGTYPRMQGLQTQDQERHVFGRARGRVPVLFGGQDIPADVE